MVVLAVEILPDNAVGLETVHTLDQGKSEAKGSVQGGNGRKSAVYTEYMRILSAVSTPRYALQRDREQFFNGGWLIVDLSGWVRQAALLLTVQRYGLGQTIQ